MLRGSWQATEGVSRNSQVGTDSPSNNSAGTESCQQPRELDANPSQSSLQMVPQFQLTAAWQP